MDCCPGVTASNTEQFPISGSVVWNVNSVVGYLVSDNVQIYWDSDPTDYILATITAIGTNTITTTVNSYSGTTGAPWSPWCFVYQSGPVAGVSSSSSTAPNLVSSSSVVSSSAPVVSSSSSSSSTGSNFNGSNWLISPWMFGIWPNLSITAGNTITFVYNSPHTVWNWTDNNCTQAIAQQCFSSPCVLTPTSFPVYYGCTVPTHCPSHGMHFSVDLAAIASSSSSTGPVVVSSSSTAGLISAPSNSTSANAWDSLTSPQQGLVILAAIVGFIAVVSVILFMLLKAKSNYSPLIPKV